MRYAAKVAMALWLTICFVTTANAIESNELDCWKCYQNFASKWKQEETEEFKSAKKLQFVIATDSSNPFGGVLKFGKMNFNSSAPFQYQSDIDATSYKTAINKKGFTVGIMLTIPLNKQ